MIMSSKLADKNGENSNDHSRDLLRDSLEKMRLSTQKLMIYEVLSSQTSIFAALSASANCLSKRALGVEVSGLQSHPSSNLRAYSYILIQALTKGSLSQQTAKGVAEKLDSLREKPPVLKNYTCAQKFRPGEMLEIFGAMQAKVADLLDGGLNLNEILKVHSCYLDLTAFFLRALLANVGMANSDDCGVRLPTSDVFSILSEYLDLSYIANKSVYLFPQIKYFIGSPDDVEFIFGKYYDNSEELKSNEFEIRQSTIDHINKGNEKYESMKISKINLDVTMSEFLFPEKLADLPGPCSSKAPTPEFGQNNYMGFEELLGYNSEEEAVNMSKKSPKESNEKETKPESNANPPAETEHEDELEKHRESVFTKKVCVQEVMTPSANGKNVIGSAFYLHEFDFYHRSNLQNNEVTQKFCSERVLLKGSSMVEKGQLFLQQVGELKREIENQMMDRDRDRHHLMSSNDLHESVSIHNMGQSNERRSRNPSPKSHNAKSEAVYDNRSCNSGFSKPSPKNMGLNSYVYGFNIEADDHLRQKHKRSSKDKGPVAPKSTSQNKSAKARQIAGPGPKMKPQLTMYHSPRMERVKVGPKQVGFRASEAPESCGPKTYLYPNRNYNHIHIHIHNDGQAKQGQPKQIQPVRMEKGAARETDIHYEIKGTDLQHAFQSTIPKLIKQIENQDLYGSVKPNGPIKAPTQKFVSPTPKDYLARVHQLNNIDSEKYLMDKSHAHEDKLKKRKSEEGFQTISMELAKHPVVMKERIYYHVPSFLRKKEQPQDETTSNINKSRDQKQGKPVNTHGTTRCSPQPALASKERLTVLKKEEKYNLNLRSGVVGKCSTDLETPTFGTPSEHRNSPKAYGKP